MRTWDKFLNFLGFEWEEVDDTQEEKENFSSEKKHRNKNNVVSLDEVRSMRLMVLRPKDFEQVKIAADSLKARKPLILNLEETKREEAQRILDFVAGSAYALNCSIQQISLAIFLVTPPNVEVNGDDLRELSLGENVRWQDSLKGRKDDRLGI
jgi:cell division inhibitor SepF